MSHKSTPSQTSPDSQELGLERLVFFSDGIMAIAITLLAIDLKVPELAAANAATELPLRLTEMTPRFMSFVISFVVVGIYWTSHHRYFRYIKRYDAKLIVLNMAFLFCIVLMPFVADLLGRYAYLPLGIIPYAAAVAFTGYSISAIWWYASQGHRLIDDNLDKHFINARNRVALVVPTLFLISIPVAAFNPTLGILVWWIAPAISFVLIRWTR